MKLNALNLVIHAEAVTVILIIALLSLKFKLLSRSGVLASIPIGYVIYVFGGVEYFILLLVFYLTSGIATKFRVKQVGKDVMDKDWIRSWRNVVANGATAAAISLLSIMEFNRGPVTAAYLGAVGTAFADTLATEVGLLYPREPRLITNMRRVMRGTPGAVSPYGYIGGVAALLILSLFSAVTRIASLKIIIAMIISGTLGMTIDSVLGATIQSKYKCTVCGRLTESRVHCGRVAERAKGISFIDTHAVNLISTQSEL
ncbi:MAG: hypothetical protein DRN49_01075 [Thaumarchaeota archaeon]|nr:MAG: hypothetical protein DRN49_01075 [Nitrososphaerota archaeon]